ncbi:MULTISPECIES: hypothetical protein [Paenibacillus]|uniref:Uncharacterized protein n=1 Tax=Paenibacillus albilobatus TaxID=2716884 RepID=A0A919XJM9_9BACL|nr:MULTISPECIES: hypothetical protein [Paenibacillus]GIO32969.1 hypothetical protein J2TS6_41100 [Paenibacillus albilobatus]
MTAQFKGNKMNIAVCGLLLVAALIRLLLQWTSDYTRMQGAWNIVLVAALVLLSFRFVYVYVRFIRIQDGRVKIVNIQGTRTFEAKDVEKVLIYDHWIRFTMKADRDVFIHLKDLDVPARVSFVAWVAEHLHIEKD